MMYAWVSMQRTPRYASCSWSSLVCELLSSYWNVRRCFGGAVHSYFRGASGTFLWPVVGSPACSWSVHWLWLVSMLSGVSAFSALGFFTLFHNAVPQSCLRRSPAYVQTNEIVLMWLGCLLCPDSYKVPGICSHERSQTIGGIHTIRDAIFFCLLYHKKIHTNS